MKKTTLIMILLTSLTLSLPSISSTGGVFYGATKKYVLKALIGVRKGTTLTSIQKRNAKAIFDNLVVKNDRYGDIVVSLTKGIPSLKSVVQVNIRARSEAMYNIVIKPVKNATKETSINARYIERLMKSSSKNEGNSFHYSIETKAGNTTVYITDALGKKSTEQVGSIFHKLIKKVKVEAERI